MCGVYNVDLTMDLSIIAPDGYKLNASHAPVSRPCQLTPIKEEFSGSSKSSLSTRSDLTSCQKYVVIFSATVGPQYPLLAVVTPAIQCPLIVP